MNHKIATLHIKIYMRRYAQTTLYILLQFAIFMLFKAKVIDVNDVSYVTEMQLKCSYKFVLMFIM